MCEEIRQYELDPALLTDSDGLSEVLRLLREESDSADVTESPVAMFKFIGAKQVVMEIDMSTGWISLPGDIEQTERALEFIECVNAMAPMHGIRSENARLKDLLARALKRGISPQDKLRFEIEGAIR